MLQVGRRERDLESYGRRWSDGLAHANVDWTVTPTSAPRAPIVRRRALRGTARSHFGWRKERFPLGRSRVRAPRLQRVRSSRPPSRHCSTFRVDRLARNSSQIGRSEMETERPEPEVEKLAFDVECEQAVVRLRCADIRGDACSEEEQELHRREIAAIVPAPT